MKKHSMLKLLFALGFVFALYSCTDEDSLKGKEPYSELNAIYTNKSSAPQSANNLSLKYSDMALLGKKVHFELKEGGIATVTLFEVIPGELKTVLEDIPVTASGQGYTFAGSATSTTGFSYTYFGDVIKGNMVLEIKNISISNNPLTANGSFKIVKQQDSEEMEDAGYAVHHKSAVFRVLPATSNIFYKIVSNALGALMHTVLDEITFHTDGNVTARYAGFPEDLDVSEDIVNGNGVANRPESDWKESPKNMVFYYVSNGYLYVIPNVENIVEQVFSDNDATRADEGSEEETEASGSDDGLDLEAIKDLYLHLTDWCTEGIRFEIRENPSAVHVLDDGSRGVYEGDYLLSLEKDQLDPIFPLLPLVAQLIPDSAADENPFVGMLPSILDNMSRNLPKADAVEINIYLNK